MERNITGEEAKRWFNTAEKLLAARDFLGAKSFAIRVREAYPGLEAVDDLVAIADTLLVGEQRINNHHDWYGILQLPRYTQSVELVATQYRRLALLLNPHRNRLPHSDEAFRLVCEAWSVLSNPAKRAFYDNELNMFPRYDFGAVAGSGSVSGPAQLQERQFLQRHQHYQQPPPPPQQSQHLQSKFQAQAQAQPPPQSQPQSKEQQQRSVRKSPRNKDGRALEEEEEERPNLNNVAESTRSARPTESARGAAESDGKNFWTACPYCYILYEYPKVYEECVLRCQNCKRAFHAAVIPSPPVAGKDDTYFCCWGFFPLGFSGNAKDASGSSGWMPFSPMFACPIQDDGKKNGGGGKGKRPSGGSPRYIYKDDDVFVELSDDSDESDDDWRNTRSSRRDKRTKTWRGKGTPAKNAKTAPTDRVTRASQSVGGQKNAGSGENLDGGVGAASKGAVPKGESSRKVKAVASGGKKKGSVEWGRLDLNVEFSNDVEESAATGMNKGNGAGHGEEDNIEGIGFFEGLDEFLSSLPILNVVGDDKVKAT
ncbi:Terminal organelle assembly protein [Parasponia andersonii]|uniref:Terminal organelle assembly protein n=1 Tax=Parasponia andersonii TaxID=3476 RepID=A0A2P5ALT6_PARAD|nr:Terminal organelle assembly protein [Parasponia andersonii]